ncbi:hypothetical protein JCM10207_006800 [Rhodosporidiobolus poonsookiae]
MLRSVARTLPALECRRCAPHSPRLSRHPSSSTSSVPPSLDSAAQAKQEPSKEPLSLLPGNLMVINYGQFGLLLGVVGLFWWTTYDNMSKIRHQMELKEEADEGRFAILAHKLDSTLSTAAGNGHPNPENGRIAAVPQLHGQEVATADK